MGLIKHCLKFRVPIVRARNCSSVVLVYKNGLVIQNSLIYNRIMCEEFQMKEKDDFEHLLKHHGFSEKPIKELWKWYDPSEKKGVASY